MLVSIFLCDLLTNIETSDILPCYSTKTTDTTKDITGGSVIDVIDDSIIASVYNTGTPIWKQLNNIKNNNNNNLQ